MLESLRPTLARTAGRIRFLRERLMHSQAGLAAVLFERDRRHRFSAFVFQDAGPDDPLRLDDFAINAVDPMVFAKPAHTEPIRSADAEIHLAVRHRKPVGRKPSLQIFRLTESLEHERPRRIKDPRDSQFGTARFDFSIWTHANFSCFCARPGFRLVSGLLGEVIGPPRT